MGRLMGAVGHRWERFRTSLFWAPVLFVLGALAAARAVLWVDGHLLEDPPGWMISDAGAARAVLGAIAGGTITVAGIVFSVSVVAVQLAAGQMSPRVLRSFLRDPVQQVILGFVVGTFTYDLLVLSEITGTRVPALAVSLSVVGAVAAVVALLGFVDHIARRVRPDDLVSRITGETTDLIRRAWVDHPSPPGHAVPRPATTGRAVVCARSGWITRIDRDRILGGLCPGDVVHIDRRPGRFVIAGHPLGTVWSGAPDAPELVAGAVSTARERTLTEDATYGVRQLTDIALRALSPGVNDVTTAYESMVHVAALVDCALRHLPPPRVRHREGVWLLEPDAVDHLGFIEEAFSQLRIAGAALPSFTVALCHHLGELARVAAERGSTAAASALARQARLAVEACRPAAPTDADREALDAAVAWVDELDDAPDGRSDDTGGPG